MTRWWLVVAAVTCALGTIAAGEASLPPAAASEDLVFSRDVLPILSDHCFRCHGPDPKARKADLRLDRGEEALRKADPVIVPGNSDESELIRRVLSQDDDERMPPPKTNRTLTASQVGVLKRWIDQGAAWGKHWAYEPPQRPPTPTVRDTSWPKNPIDDFVLARLEREGLRPAAEAPRDVLIRRLTLDLTGLPPTLAEVDAFAADPSADAYEKQVDRLLASPHYGERMAWDWLDAARYADSNGYQGDQDRTMWPWRDWVVRALNANMPYDRFTVEQLAGDLLPGATTEQRIATAFNRNHMINGEGGRIAEESRVEYVMDETETMATVWLGITLTCCRCHDHKFDPFTQRDYYQLYAFFNRTPVTGEGRSGQIQPVTTLASEEFVAKRGRLKAEYEALLKPLREKEKRLREAAGATAGRSESTLPTVIDSALGSGPVSRAEATRRELIQFFRESEPDYVDLLGRVERARQGSDGFARRVPQVMVMEDMPVPRDTFILARGAYDKPVEKVAPGVPGSLSPWPGGAPRNRLGLARWLVDPGHPLTARVTVNRYWQTFVGIGLVKTPDDFGVQGERPSHPELLDWLATEFIRTGWDVKAMHRLIVTSATYRQSSEATAALLERDPENRLHARGARYRLPSWVIRDQALAVGGLLVDQPGGPPVNPYQPEGIWEEATFGKIVYRQDHGEALYRRSLSTFWRRIVGPTTFFDNAARQVCSVKAPRTNTPSHALTTLNDTTYVEAARGMAERVLQHRGATPEARIATAYRLATARRPSRGQQRILRGCFERLRRSYAANPAAAMKLLSVGESPRDVTLDAVEHAAYTALCSLILNLDETLTRQ